MRPQREDLPAASHGEKVDFCSFLKINTFFFYLIFNNKKVQAIISTVGG